MKQFEGNTANDIWLQVVESLTNSIDSTTASRIGETTELLHAGITIFNARERWITSRIPAINPAFALAEVVWIINGSRDADIINYWNPVLPKFAGKVKDYHGAYGSRLVSHFNMNQLHRAYLTLKQNKESRQVVLQIWDPAIDFPDKNGKPVADDIPCNICSLLKIRDQKLEWLQIIRSNDIFRGLPFNIVQFTTLQEIMAGWLKIEVGSYNQISDSLHLYKNDRENFSYNSEKETEKNCDDLRLPYTESMRYFELIFEKMKSMKSKDISKKSFCELINDVEIKNVAMKNILFVIASDAARRKGWCDIKDELIDSCTNPLYQKLIQKWNQRNTITNSN